MMGGSLDSLARQFPGSRLRLDQIGQIFGEREFGPLSQSVTGAVEAPCSPSGSPVRCSSPGEVALMRR